MDTFHAQSACGRISGQSLILKTNRKNISDGVMVPFAVVTGCFGEGGLSSDKKKSPGTREKTIALLRTEDGFIVENEGVTPDVEVEQTPKDVIVGKDPQLEKAIPIAIEELEKNPTVVPDRPAFPFRVRP